MIKRDLVNLAKKWVDGWLSRLALSESCANNLILLGLEALYPRGASRVYFRNGQLSRSRILAQRGHDYLNVERLDAMLEVLSEPYVSSSKAPTKRADPLRVLQVFHSCETFDANGYGVRSRQIVKALVAAQVPTYAMTRLGYPWDLIVHRQVDPNMSESSADGVSYMHQRGKLQIGSEEGSYVREYGRVIARNAQELGATVIHAHSNYLNGLAASLAGRQLNIPVVYEMRGLWHRTRGLSSARYRRSEHYAYCEKQEINAARLADRVVVLSQGMMDWLVELGIERSKITVVSNATEGVREVTRVPQKQLTIGYVGSIVGYEGLEILAEAMKIITQRYPDAKMLIAGSGASKQALLSKVKNLNLHTNFVDCGILAPNEVNLLYGTFDIAVVPRLSNEVTEIVPSLKPVEILGRGVPLILSDIAPHNKLVAEAKAALLVEPGNAEKLAEAVFAYANDPILVCSNRQAGLNWSRNNCWDKNADLYKSVYDAQC